jgi:hypothetical protein
MIFNESWENRASAEGLADGVGGAAELPLPPQAVTAPVAAIAARARPATDLREE